MRQLDLLLVYEYNYWANHRILAATAQLTHAQFVAPAAHGRGGLRGILVHTLDGEYSWRQLLQFNTMTFDLTEADFPTLAALQARWAEDEPAMRAYLAGLTDEALSGIIRYTVEGGSGGSACSGTACSMWSIMGPSIAVRRPCCPRSDDGEPLEAKMKRLSDFGCAIRPKRQSGWRIHLVAYGL